MTIFIVPVQLQLEPEPSARAGTEPTKKGSAPLLVYTDLTNESTVIYILFVWLGSASGGQNSARAGGGAPDSRVHAHLSGILSLYSSTRYFTYRYSL